MAQTKLAEEKNGDRPIAHELAKQQREISVAEFFEKNRHLLGFNNPRKALLTAIKEAVDNSLDACEEAKILPELHIEMIDMQNDRFRIIVEDNGPGIVKSQIPNIFAKLLYGSKFHRLKMGRGQQGIGISAAALYGQLTTGKPIKIKSKISPKDPAHYYELHIDTQKNKPEVVKEEIVEWKKEQGTRIELDLEGIYQKGPQSVDNYLKQTAIVNPHATIIYTNPKAEQIIFARATNVLPKEPKEIKPHPYGVEIGMLMKMMKNTEGRTMQSFFANDFSRVSPGVAKEICTKAGILPNSGPKSMTREQAERIINAIKDTKIIAPPTDCVSPIGGEDLKKGLKKEINAEFYCATTRPPAVYRGNPFIIEVAIAYGGELGQEDTVKIMRFANRVPLLYQQSACVSTEAIIDTNWKSYGLQQSKDSMPYGPAVILVHMASVWVPFTSEAKEAIAHYPDITKEIKLALQECGRELLKYTAKKRKYSDELKKRGYIEKYIPFIGEVLKDLLDLKKSDEENIEKNLKELLEKSRGKLEDVAEENAEYDESFAKIGAEKESEEEPEEGSDEDADKESGKKSKKRAKDE
ncbi:DNA topoisomerase VI subunit B [Candidatus Woesearchaeota archaeon CG10_big_fil_rev_8_21_14_0_10_44_13]|nr:MAG: DNA topoisomerase VI subunit B [Candidatus Woesearchaeota archaeon CG10_big_fil_rev_8_21_14_0_10_44_13]